MKSKPEMMKVRRLIKLREQNVLKPNWEYQRGAVWNEEQMRLLIDSILRRYHIPLIYLRHVKKGDEEYIQDVLEIIDGQQRINAIHGFSKDVIIEERPENKQVRSFKPLFDPAKEGEREMFPDSIQKQECPWAGKTYDSLPEEYRARFLDAEISVVKMECTDDEARDLFIRLQGGSSLAPQEVRDAWPGNFCQHVLKLGGKPQFNLPGHEFFPKVMRARPASDRGNTRRLAAQMLMLFLTRRQHGADAFTTIKTGELDNFYRQQVGIALDSPEIKRFVKILDKMTSLIGDGNRKPIKGHDAIHLLLLVDSLMDEFTPNWESALANAFDQFSGEILKMKKVPELTGQESKEDRDAWNYYQMTRSRSDQAEIIRRRHSIYMRHMLRFLGSSVKRKDPKRLYDADARELIYYRDEKKCHFCKSEVTWGEAEIHHVQPHSQGGSTTLENGVLVHQKCHPRGSQPSG